MSDQTKITQSIVRPLSSPGDAAPAVDLSLLDPAFFSRQAWLKPPPEPVMGKVIDHLAHKVSRNPTDLMSHVQRIALSHEIGDGEQIYGALLDLFIALGPGGVSLRTRMLQKVADLLDDDQLEALQRGLVSGIAASDPVPPSRHSRLSNAVTGDTEIVVPVDTSAPAAEFDTIDEARDLIDSGHIELAQKLLEEELLVNRHREDISRELLEIYRHTRHQEALFSMRRQLGDAPFALAEDWEELINSFTEQETPGGGVNG